MGLGNSLRALGLFAAIGAGGLDAHAGDALKDVVPRSDWPSYTFTNVQGCDSIYEGTGARGAKLDIGSGRDEVIVNNVIGVDHDKRLLVMSDFPVCQDRLIKAELASIASAILGVVEESTVEPEPEPNVIAVESRQKELAKWLEEKAEKERVRNEQIAMEAAEKRAIEEAEAEKTRLEQLQKRFDELHKVEEAKKHRVVSEEARKVAEAALAKLITKPEKLSPIQAQKILDEYQDELESYINSANHNLKTPILYTVSDVTEVGREFIVNRGDEQMKIIVIIDLVQASIIKTKYSVVLDGETDKTGRNIESIFGAVVKLMMEAPVDEEVVVVEAVVKEKQLFKKVVDMEYELGAHTGIYSGSAKLDGTPHGGAGVLNINGTIFKGTFNEGILDTNLGMISFADGSRFRGRISNGVPMDPKGKYWDVNGVLRDVKCIASAAAYYCEYKDANNWVKMYWDWEDLTFISKKQLEEKKKAELWGEGTDKQDRRTLRVGDPLEDIESTGIPYGE